MLLHLRLLSLCLALSLSAAWAGEADVVGAETKCEGGACRFSVTVRHADTGWDHYADHWRVLTPDGNELGRRVLLHPHVNEQPFTRALEAVSVPEGIGRVVIEAHDSIHGYGGESSQLELPSIPR